MTDKQAQEIEAAVKVLAGKMDLATVERLFILETVAGMSGTQQAKADRLGITVRTLRSKLKRYRAEQ